MWLVAILVFVASQFISLSIAVRFSERIKKYPA
jgi:hypothetical protein